MFLSFFRKTLGNNKESKDVEEQKQIKAEEIKDMIYGNITLFLLWKPVFVHSKAI